MSKELKSELELLEFLEDRDKLPNSWIIFWSFEPGEYSCGAIMVDGENISERCGPHKSFRTSLVVPGKVHSQREANNKCSD